MKGGSGFLHMPKCSGFRRYLYGEQMTFWDIAMTWPFWAQIIVVLICGTWMFEMFLYPFKQNIQRKRIKDLLDVQRKLMEQLEKRTFDLEKTNAMLATVMSLILKHEQQEEDMKAAQKSKAKDGGEKQQPNTSGDSK